MSTIRLVQTDNGIVVSGVVKDDGDGRDLTAATVVIRLRADQELHTVTGTPDPDQVTNPGAFTGTFTDVHLELADTKATAEVVITEGSTEVTYPDDAPAKVAIRPRV